MSMIELEKSAMAFKLKDGQLLLISKEDVTEIANKLAIEMLVNKKSIARALYTDNVMEKANLLYKVITEQDKKMPKEIRSNYLKAILDSLEMVSGDEVNVFKELMANYNSDDKKLES